MDGLWSGSRLTEQLRQAQLMRHRLLTINLGLGTLNVRDASSYGQSPPNGISATSARGLEGGPHFLMSPETPDGRPTLGFEFCLTVRSFSPGDAAAALAPGFTVVVWELIGNMQTADGAFVPNWAAFETLTGVNFDELYHSFDINTTALRFQIYNFDPAAGRSLMIAFCEL